MDLYLRIPNNFQSGPQRRSWFNGLAGDDPMMTARVSKPDNACPLCKMDLDDPKTVDRLQRQFDSDVSKRARDLTKQQLGKYRDLIKEINDQKRAEIQKLRLMSKEEQRELKDRLTDNLRKEKVSKKAALAKQKKTYQDQLRALRDAYDRESLRLQKENESSFNVQLQEIIRNYGSLATGHQKELERLKKIHDENDALLRKKDSEVARLKIELAKSSSKLQVKDMALQLHDRDDTIERLNGRIQELEGKLQAPQRPAPKEPQKTLSDEEQREKLKEYMRAIIEITRNQQAEKKRADSSSDEEKPRQELTNSKVDKKLGWFF
jgi:DNA repair exonuclease SbcCD ATPase subunit